MQRFSLALRFGTASHFRLAAALERYARGMGKTRDESIPTSTKNPVPVKIAPFDGDLARAIYVEAVSKRPGSANAEQLHALKAQAIMAAQVWGHDE